MSRYRLRYGKRRPLSPEVARVLGDMVLKPRPLLHINPNGRQDPLCGAPHGQPTTMYPGDYAALGHPLCDACLDVLAAEDHESHDDAHANPSCRLCRKYLSRS